MILFVLYACAMWYGCCRWRRQWLGLLALVAGLGGLALVAWTHTMLNNMIAGGINLIVLRCILFPYIAMVAAVSVFLWCLRRTAPTPQHCQHCFYDMRGLEGEAESCPECGRRHEHAALSRAATAAPRPAPAP